MAIPKLPPPPKTGDAQVDSWLNTLYEWAGKASIDGLRKVNGKIVAKSRAVPSAPVVAEAQRAIPIGQQFAFNYIDATEEAVDGYWIYKSDTSNNVSTARKYKTVNQSNDGGIYTFQDNTGAGVIAYYWVSAFNSKGESAKISAGTASASLGATEVSNDLRPTTHTGSGYVSPEAAYDNNLNASSRSTLSVKGIHTMTWAGFPAASGTPTAIVLNVAHELVAGVDDFAQIEYSLDGGVNFTELSNDAADFHRTDKTAVGTIPAGQDTTQVQVRAIHDRISNDATATNHDVYEVWLTVQS